MDGSSRKCRICLAHCFFPQKVKKGIIGSVILDLILPNRKDLVDELKIVGTLEEFWTLRETKTKCKQTCILGFKR